MYARVSDRITRGCVYELTSEIKIDEGLANNTRRLLRQCDVVRVGLERANQQSECGIR